MPFPELPCVAMAPQRPALLSSPNSCRLDRLQHTRACPAGHLLAVSRQLFVLSQQLGAEQLAAGPQSTASSKLGGAARLAQWRHTLLF